MVEKLSSARTISAASFATLVPVPIATPMALCCSAGASLTPSPVMAGISPSCCNIFTNFCLSAGCARQNTMLSRLSISSCSSSSFRKNSLPSKALRVEGSASASKIFTSLAMAIAVSRASPVIIITRMPAWEHSRMLAGTSGRAGSLIPTIPTRVNPLSMSLYFDESFKSGWAVASIPSNLSKLLSSFDSSFTAKAKHRSGRTAISVIFASIDRLSDPVSFTTLPSLIFTCVQRSNTILGAPFTRSRF
mmetsp:Transcript_17837/g.28820  ORF Transcript_17837/g.28820 Transcript_17837/m.28820 type:complete len:248 (-) Transcript_17837:440-1183(-)